MCENLLVTNKLIMVGDAVGDNNLLGRDDGVGDDDDDLMITGDSIMSGIAAWSIALMSSAC